MTDYLNTREPGQMFTDSEFARIPREDTGEYPSRLIDLPDAYPFITTKQRELLHDDDWSYMIDLDEEMDSLIAEAREEFGL